VVKSLSGADSSVAVDEEPVKAILSREGINLERLRELLEKTEN